LVDQIYGSGNSCSNLLLPAPSGNHAEINGKSGSGPQAVADVAKLRDLLRRSA
jgi:hypothetical protein